MASPSCLHTLEDQAQPTERVVGGEFVDASDDDIIPLAKWHHALPSKRIQCRYLNRGQDPTSVLDKIKQQHAKHARPRHAKGESTGPELESGIDRSLPRHIWHKFAYLHELTTHRISRVNLTVKTCLLTFVSSSLSAGSAIKGTDGCSCCSAIRICLRFSFCNFGKYPTVKSLQG